VNLKCPCFVHLCLRLPSSFLVLRVLFSLFRSFSPNVNLHDPSFSLSIGPISISTSPSPSAYESLHSRRRHLAMWPSSHIRPLRRALPVAMADIFESRAVAAAGLPSSISVSVSAVPTLYLISWIRHRRGIDAVRWLRRGRITHATALRMWCAHAPTRWFFASGTRGHLAHT
jgi:hypothetical protein